MLLVGAATTQVLGVLALLLLAGATAASMALASAGFGYVLARGPIAGRLTQVVPALGVASLLFGVWYTVGAIRG